GGFFEQTCYTGALSPDPNADWTTVSTWGNHPTAAQQAGPNGGWTYYDTTGANRKDLHLVGMPDPRPLAIYNNINLYSPRTFAPDSNYEIRGQLRVKDQTTLTIPAGVVVFPDQAAP